MNKKSRIELDREILSSVTKEMEKPRLAASVRDSQEAEAALAARALAVHPAKA
ncbi:MAG: hypothetical protein ABSB30_15335 [Terracidiphilus sp.]